jgi:hypothetical protein
MQYKPQHLQGQGQFSSMKKLKYYFLSLTSLLPGCVSSSVQLNDEYLFWKKWKEMYWHTSRREWGHWLSFCYSRSPLVSPPFLERICSCVMSGVSNSTLRNPCNTPILKAVCHLHASLITKTSMELMLLSEPFLNKRAEFLAWQCKECSFWTIFLFMNFILMIWKTTHNRFDFDLFIIKWIE